MDRRASRPACLGARVMSADTRHTAAPEWQSVGQPWTSRHRAVRPARARRRREAQRKGPGAHPAPYAQAFRPSYVAKLMAAYGAMPASAGSRPL